jgi:Ca2+-binding RTX toxin-like protein
MVYAGDGDDVVDGTAAPDQTVYVELGSGTDTFTGGDRDDRVSVAYPDPGTGADVIHGGGGSDQLSIQTGPGAAYVDNVAGRFLSAGVERATWTSVEQFWLWAPPAPRDLTFVGSDADEAVYDATNVASTTDVDLRGGDDAYYGQTAPALGSRFNGGDGRDRLWVASGLGELHLDLKDGLLDRGPASEWVVAADDFEDADLFARRVTLTGTNGPNELGVQACSAKVRGRSGDDVIERRYEGVFDVFRIDCREHMIANGGSDDDEINGTGGRDKLVGGKGRDRLNGMRGSDRLVGGRGHDHLRGKDQGDTLLGGRGNDHADGGNGRRDVCRAEHERRCER